MLPGIWLPDTVFSANFQLMKYSSKNKEPVMQTVNKKYF